jgi:hypothetical protein
MSHSGHSTEVRIHLSVNGHVFSVAQLGPGFVVLRDATDHPPTAAEVRLSIDGDETRWPVEVVDGIVAGQRKTRIRRGVPHVNGQSGG